MSERHRHRSRRSGRRRLGPFREVKALLRYKSYRDVLRKPPRRRWSFSTKGVVCRNHAFGWEVQLGGSCSQKRPWRAGRLRNTGALPSLRRRFGKTLVGSDLLRLPRQTPVHRCPLLPSMWSALQQKCGSGGVWSLPDPAAQPFSLGQSRRAIQRRAQGESPHAQIRRASSSRLHSGTMGL